MTLIAVPEEEPDGVLTPRELEILKLVAKEFNSRQIVEVLFISEANGRNPPQKCFKKIRSHQSGRANQICLCK